MHSAENRTKGKSKEEHAKLPIFHCRCRHFIETKEQKLQEQEQTAIAPKLLDKHPDPAKEEGWEGEPDLDRFNASDGMLVYLEGLHLMS